MGATQRSSSRTTTGGVNRVMSAERVGIGEATGLDFDVAEWIADVRALLEAPDMAFVERLLAIVPKSGGVAVSEVRRPRAIDRGTRRRSALLGIARGTAGRGGTVRRLARGANDLSSALAGGRREIATLFTDIAGFTALVEKLDPDVLTTLLGDYMSGMTEIVFEREGTVAKIIGDAIHVLFGAPFEQPDSAARAIDCALALDAWAEEFRLRWREKGVPVGHTRIGVHAGPAVVGNFGGGRLFEYTAYGDTINAAARLENANKAFGTRICVSAAAVERAGDFSGRPIGDLALRGRLEPMRAYEPLRQTSAWTEAYARAFDKLEAKDPAALAAFAALVGERPEDALAQYHLRRLLNGESGARLDLT